MNKEKAVIGFIGAGGIARSHAYSLNSLKYYYNDAPQIELQAVCSETRVSRTSFANRFGFNRPVDLEEFVNDKKINTVFILGPNKVHYKHLQRVIEMPGLQRIYLEKPVCSNIEEESAISTLTRRFPGIKIQIGFQFLLSAVVTEMINFWKSGKLGEPLHFDLKYWHSDYLRKEYRDRRTSRLTPAPDGGAMADLGSHSISLLIAFLGNRIKITGALQGGHFSDVREDSDLFSLISLYDEASGAVGTLSASRISSGAGDNFGIELYAKNGAIRYSSLFPDQFDFYLEASGIWNKILTGSDYKPASTFPSAHVPGGWLRSLIHAHYVFLSSNNSNIFVPDIEHGLAVQRLVRQTAEHLESFRKLFS